MDSVRIEQLLEKYWEGQTTLDEEKELRILFNQGQVPEKFQSVAPLFKYFTEEKKYGKLDDFFDRKILQQIKESHEPGKGRIVKMLYKVARVAAVGLILITATYFVRQEYLSKKDTIDPTLTGTLEDPKEAFEETKRALMMISNNLNMGRKQAQKVGFFYKAQEKVKETETL